LGILAEWNAAPFFEMKSTSRITQQGMSLKMGSIEIYSQNSKDDDTTRVRERISKIRSRRRKRRKRRRRRRMKAAVGWYERKNRKIEVESNANKGVKT
jgi:hypothetical protein